MALYGLDAGQSLFTVQAFAAGVLSFAAHSPRFAARDVLGRIDFDPHRLDDVEMELAVPAGRFELIDRVAPWQRAEIEGRMRGEVLHVERFPEIAYRSRSARGTDIAPGRYAIEIDGELSFHGVTRPQPIRAEIQTLETAARLVGRFHVRPSDHGITPVTALAGAIRLKDELTVSFDLISLQETP
ncbi:YceI-like domain protein [Aquisphaera giovannonii]|uniref:YceI-like domain protein n=1 Tax=Aquisphaera giovannonii TaxID=406548 RepID=A0A5B9W416_9BACT|nr:YceI family protein [Aquisphaera giovannonii]QEH34835.1 YceI-like domain protein [Aquisphaera giovannonii]